ncbi:MAG: hypothetical protein WCL27_00770 [Betaproteobacteria bacterium]
MKKIILLSLGMLAASQVFAQATGTACPTLGKIPAADTTLFVVREAPIRCSANVTASYIQNTIAFSVGALSSKGKSYFQGTSGGGAISAQSCTGQTCTVGQELTGLQAKLDLAT